MVVEEGRPLSELRAPIPRFPQVLLAVEVPEPGSSQSMETMLGIVELETRGSYFGDERQQPVVGRDGGAGTAAAARLVPLGVGLSRVQ